MENYKTIFKNHLPAFAALAFIILCVFAFWLTGYLKDVRQDAALGDAIGNNQTEAQTAVSEAANAQNAAVNSSIERRTEDAVRQRVITPKLEAARRNSTNSKIQLEKAKKKYSDEQITHKNISNSVAANCVQLARLYPNTRFDYCADGTTFTTRDTGGRANR